jgi:hypothetical protein
MNAYLQIALATLKKRRPEEYVAVLLGVLALLILAQGFRCSAIVIGTNTLLHSLEQINAPPPRKVDAEAAAKYEIILEKGILGRVVKDAGGQQLRVFGILGNTVLMGRTPESIKPYEIGAEVEGGEKLVKIEASSAVLEKDGKQRSLTVFQEDGPKPPEGGQPPTGPQGDKPPGPAERPGEPVSVPPPGPNGQPGGAVAAPAPVSGAPVG